MSEARKVEQPDPLVDEVRSIRAGLDREFGGDWRQYADHIRQMAAKLQNELAGSSEDPKVKKEPPC